MKKVIVISVIVALAVLSSGGPRAAVHAAQQAQALTPDQLDTLVAPIALYPDQLLAQMLLCAQNPGNIDALNLWLGKNAALKGSDLQTAVANAGFEPQYVTLAVFPQVVKMMADQLEWTTRLGIAFTSDRAGVMAAMQRLRKKASDVGTLKSTEQQEVTIEMTSSGEQAIVIEPANPQVVYVPQYNTTTVYTQAPSTTTVIVQSDDNTDEAVAAGMIGFTAGIAMGAAFSNPYHYGPYGWYGGAHMYNDAWDDYYDHREDAREDFYDNREDLAEERTERAENARDERTDRQENRTENRPESQQQRTERQQNRQANGTQTQRASGQTATATSRSPSAESRGYSEGREQQVRQQSTKSSDAFSGYSSGKSERAASQRGTQSRSSSSRSRGGGGGGGGGRRR